MDLGLTGKLALVTGSSAGIGYAICEALVREGARVIVSGRSTESVDAAVGTLNALGPGEAVGFAGDMSSRGHRCGSRPPLSGGGDSRQQPGHLRAEGLRGDHRRRVEALLRRERAERRSSGAALPAGDEAAQLGPHHLHLQRKRRADSRGDDSLRCDEDGAARGVARPRRRRRRHRHHRQLRAARTDPLAGRRETSSKRSRSGKARRSTSSRRNSSRRSGQRPSSSGLRDRRRWGRSSRTWRARFPRLPPAPRCASTAAW